MCIIIIFMEAESGAKRVRKKTISPLNGFCSANLPLGVGDEEKSESLKHLILMPLFGMALGRKLLAKLS